MDRYENQGTHDELQRPRFLPPLSLSPFLQRREFELLQNPNAGGETAETATKMTKLEKDSVRDPRRRRNGICEMLMPAEYFAALPRLELLNVRYEFGLDTCQ